MMSSKPRLSKEASLKNAARFLAHDKSSAINTGQKAVWQLLTAEGRGDCFLSVDFQFCKT